jgi:hypothetical protein
MSSTMPSVIESVGELGQRVEQGFVYPDDIASDRLLGVYRALLSADAALERSRQRVANRDACRESDAGFGLNNPVAFWY